MAKLSNQEVSIRNLETQIGQIAKAINERAQCTLPSDTEKNPKKHCKAFFDEELEIAQPHQLDIFHEECYCKVEIDEQNKKVEIKEEVKDDEQNECLLGVMEKEEFEPKEEELTEKLPFTKELDEELDKYLEIVKHMHDTSTAVLRLIKLRFSCLYLLNY